MQWHCLHTTGTLGNYLFTLGCQQAINVFAKEYSDMTSTHKILIFLLVSSILGGCAPAVIVGGSVTAAHDRRTLGSFVEDQNIELKAYDAIAKDQDLQKQSHISVTSYNGIVLLSGQTPSAELRAKAEERARSVEKVKKVHNELTIAAPSSMGVRSTDTWVTSKVKTSLLKVKGHKDFDPTRVKVVTENGTVYLMGILKQAEAEDVIDVVRKVGGVQRVVKIFEYENQAYDVTTPSTSSTPATTYPAATY
jgi:osmotically-inducible protein OsmY